MVPNLLKIIFHVSQKLCPDAELVWPNSDIERTWRLRKPTLSRGHTMQLAIGNIPKERKTENIYKSLFKRGILCRD